MKAIAVLLIVAVFVRHDAIYTLADAFGYTPAAMAYILGGAFEATLAAVIGLIVFAAVKWDVWRDLALWACGIAILEGLMQSGCRLAVSNIGLVPQRTNMCDYVTGLPVGQGLAALYLLAVVWCIGRWLARQE